MGVSLRVRGSLGLLWRRVYWKRYVPARAGKLAAVIVVQFVVKAYPCWRGETGVRGVICDRQIGISLLARGNRLVTALASCRVRRIPARAG